MLLNWWARCGCSQGYVAILKTDKFPLTLIKFFFMITDYIEQKSGVPGGKPIIKDTRVGIDLLLEKIGVGESIEELLKAYPFK